MAEEGSPDGHAIGENLEVDVRSETTPIHHDTLPQQDQSLMF